VRHGRTAYLTPNRDKGMVPADNGHVVPLDVTMRESLAWFDRYLSGKTDGTILRD